ncbi:prephenate dehydrogenase [Canibacter sp. lx-72]|uniref:prephenate dehydrogenase n=1 Tax=Canibacter zhuwentaonis TaxID=2837491 RepID=UPI001BDC0051|nr:prephenate dehydrogenase [Canibacter zhuwentaonis]
MNKQFSGVVHIVGAGLLGASIGLALTVKNTRVTLADVSPTALALAADYGAGTPRQDGDPLPQLVVVATPPEYTAEAVLAALREFPKAIVSDVASVKQLPLAQLRAAGADLARYIGSHPMAGRERGGAIRARADLFTARPWVVCAHELAAASALRLVESLALTLGAVPVRWDPAAHDSAVAAVSHLPQIIASLTAAQLLDVPRENLQLAGQGLRDTVRIASGDPLLWTQILTANSEPIVALLEGVQRDLAGLLDALRDPEARGARRQIATLLAAGGDGASRIPGKHGTSNTFEQLTVIIDDRPGQLAQLFTDLEELEINMEDMRLEHSPGAQIGFIEICVLPEAKERAVAGLTARSWRIV